MKSIKDTGVKSAPDLASNRHQFAPSAYGRVPLNLNSDKRLNGTDIRVYAAIAYHVFQGNVCREPYEKLAVAGGVTRQQVTRAVANLLGYKYILPYPGNRERHRQWFVLPSVVFGQKQRALDAGESSSEDLVSRPRKRLATARTA